MITEWEHDFFWLMNVLNRSLNRGRDELHRPLKLPQGQYEDRWWIAHENEGQDKLQVHDLDRKKQRSSSFTSCPKEGIKCFFATEKYSVLFLQDCHLLLSWMSLYLHSNYIEIYFIFTFLECICQLGDRRDIALQILMIFETLWCCGLFNNVWYMFPIALNCWKLLC